MGQHWMFLTVCGFLLAAVVGFCIFWIYSRIVRLGFQYRYRYIEDPSVFSPSRFKEDGANDTSYELGRRDD